MGHRGGNWYLRSMGDRDTHCGELQPDGSVRARCGVSFQPRPLPYNASRCLGIHRTQPRSARSAGRASPRTEGSSDERLR
jgi:hypothetical protein